MEPTQALQILEQALNKATEKGSFNMVEVNQILQAIFAVKQALETK